MTDRAAICEDCHRPLKDPASARLRRGPVCQRKFDARHGRAPAPRTRHRRLALDQPLTGFPDLTTEQAMTEQELKEYAEHLIEEHAKNVEFLSVFEMYREYWDEDEASISDEDARKVLDLIGSAKLTIAWDAEAVDLSPDGA